MNRDLYISFLANATTFRSFGKKPSLHEVEGCSQFSKDDLRDALSTVVPAKALLIGTLHDGRVLHFKLGQ